MDIYVMCMRNSRGHNSFKNNSSATCLPYAQLGLVSIVPVKLYWIVTKGCWEIVFTKYGHICVICMRNSRGHNSFKNNSSATRPQYAQLGLVPIVLAKLYWIVTKGCWEIVFTRNVYRATDRLDRMTSVTPI